MPVASAALVLLTAVPYMPIGCVLLLDGRGILISGVLTTLIVIGAAAGIAPNPSPPILPAYMADRSNRSACDTSVLLLLLLLLFPVVHSGVCGLELSVCVGVPLDHLRSASLTVSVSSSTFLTRYSLGS